MLKPSDLKTEQMAGLLPFSGADLKHPRVEARQACELRCGLATMHLCAAKAAEPVLS